MLSGLDLEIVGVNVEGCEALCLPCSAKRLGEPRSARVIAGLEDSDEWGSPEIIPMWKAHEWAVDNGEECQCHESEGYARKPEGEFCERCGELLCHDCGKRLDDLVSA